MRENRQDPNLGLSFLLDKRLKLKFEPLVFGNWLKVSLLLLEKRENARPKLGFEILTRKEAQTEV